jgi:hypothetical protein
MHFHFTKRTFLVLVGLIGLVSTLLVPGSANKVIADGGNNRVYLPVIEKPASVTAPSDPVVPSSNGQQFFVTTKGTSKGDGSSGKPWDLQTALNQPSSVKPGATIWVRGGTYSGAFTSLLKGSSSAPVILRAYPGERVTLTNSDTVVLDIKGNNYVYFWGLEITSSYSKRTESRSESTYGLRINQSVTSNNLKFINMIVHDVQSQGFGWWQAATNSEIYGSMFYYNGTTQLDHAIYTHNVSGTKLISNSMIFDNASHGVHGYADTAEKGLTNIVVDGNTLFNNGSIGYTTSKGTYGVYKRNILVGGDTPAISPVITNNSTYYPGSDGQSMNVGYSAGSKNGKVTNNYFAGGSFELGGSESSLTMTGNTVFAPGGFVGFSTGSYSSNNWLKSKPTDLKIIVRPNKYETSRAMITIYNWAKNNTVSINAANLNGVNLKAGDQYELHNAQNFYGDIVKGVYDGSSLVVPMTGHSVAQPVGLSFKPATTFPEFGAFVLVVPGK